MTKISEIMDSIWLKTKTSNPDSFYVKQGDSELLIDLESHSIAMMCKAKDFQNQLNNNRR